MIGAAGGVGTTRLTLEVGATLAADGRDTIIVDAALDTQGLAAHVAGPIEPDVTTLVTEGGDLEDGLLTYPTETAGSLRLCPAHAPFTRIAAAKAPEAAERLGTLIADATSLAEHVVVDVPPLASNTAVGGAAAADRRALITPATIRGRDALSRSLGSLADLGMGADLVVANRAKGDDLDDADLAIPESVQTDVPKSPSALSDEAGFGSAMSALTESLYAITLDVDLSAGLAGTAREYLS